ncbi:hypothetical protein F8388_026609 [Cannabis sativa]|uniref:S-protein homolog n=1 Tax=Cannabis sativa TaxID=3483 RepID=A0A7J6EC90_CANSA|nr:hypothetical protein F8388_026609 [Cannabis sativa]
MLIFNNPNYHHHLCQKTIPLFVVVIFFSLLSHKSSLCEGDKQITVKTTNGIVDTDLTLHCKSKDDDLGVQLLHYNDSFQFSFTPNIWETTLFYCSFQWKDEFHWFDIFKMKKRKILHLNEWLVNSNGPCQFDPATNSWEDSSITKNK